MATRKSEETFDGGLTIIAPEKKDEYNGPTVDIFLPALEEGGSGMKVDQYEHVTIANEHGEKHYKVHRGEHVTVPVPVYIAMKEKYPNL